MCAGCHCAGHADQRHSAAAHLPGPSHLCLWSRLLFCWVSSLLALTVVVSCAFADCGQRADERPLLGTPDFTSTLSQSCPFNSSFCVLCPATTTARVQVAGRGSPLPEAHHLPESHAASGATLIIACFLGIVGIHSHLCRVWLQILKISASGQELGGDMLFRRRFGFSGTGSCLHASAIWWQAVVLNLKRCDGRCCRHPVGSASDRAGQMRLRIRQRGQDHERPHQQTGATRSFVDRCSVRLLLRLLRSSQAPCATCASSGHAL